MRNLRIPTSIFLMFFLTASTALAWGPDGHKMIGGIADRLIAGKRAEKEVKALLGPFTLEEVSVWADCAKGVVPGKNYEYAPNRHYQECAVFETSEGKAEMSDFVRRNDKQCNPKSTEESCHKQYHYTNVSITNDKYCQGCVGTSDHDIVHLIKAAIMVLQGKPCPRPIQIKDKREALFLLAHHVGDIHQPMHAGSIYLDANGKKVNPDVGVYDEKTFTRGGNWIKVGSADMHGKWDSVPASINVSRIDARWLDDAANVIKSAGDIELWSFSWASETLGEASNAFNGIVFSNREGNVWTATLPAGYNNTMNSTKKKQVVKAGARLAELLQKIWPDQ